MLYTWSWVNRKGNESYDDDKLKITSVIQSEETR